MEFNQNTPIYLQIADALVEKILCGEWREEERIPSVRELGVQLGVNPNTIVRVYDHLERQGTIFNRRGIGFFVAPDAMERVRALQREEFIREELPATIRKMKRLNVGREEFLKILEEEFSK